MSSFFRIAFSVKFGIMLVVQKKKKTNLVSCNGMRICLW